jgi:tetratricopeptide (TPR) repeat protein
MNNKVYFLEKAEMETFVQEIYQVGEKLVQMTLENDLLKNLYLSSIKTMNNKIYTIDENIISDVDLNKLIGKFDEDIENELIKLSSKLEIMDSTTVIENTIETNESTEIITTNKNNDEMKKEENYTLYIYIGIVLATVLFVFLIFEVSPSIKKVEFLCKIGLGKYALRISEKLVMKEPNNYKNYMAMAKAFEAIGEYNSSIVCYKKAMKLKEKGEIK